MKTGTNFIIDKILQFIVAWWLPVLLFSIWWFVSYDSTSFFFPPLHKILASLYDGFASGILVKHTLASLFNMFSGLAIAITLGISIGLIIGEFKSVRNATAPTLNFLRSIPPAAIVPIVIIAMGTDSSPKIFIIALSCFWPILLNTIDGVRGISVQMTETTKAFKIPLFLVLRRVFLMAALPQIMAGIRIALAVALVIMVISEFFGASVGLGYYIRQQKEIFALVETWAATILVGILGYIISSIFLKIEARLLAWYFQTPRNKKSK